MVDEIGYFAVGAAEAERIADAHGAARWEIFRLPDDISSRQEFFEGVRHALPLDPPVLGNSGWDALDDSLWGGLDAIEEDRILIVWPGASAMASMAPEDFAIATEILAALPASLSDLKITAGEPKQLLVLCVMSDPPGDGRSRI